MKKNEDELHQNPIDRFDFLEDMTNEELDIYTELKSKETLYERESHFPIFYVAYKNIRGLLAEETALRRILAFLTIIYFFNPNMWNAGKTSILDDFVPIFLLLFTILATFSTLYFRNYILMPILFFIGTIKSIRYRQYTEMIFYFSAFVILIILFLI